MLSRLAPRRPSGRALAAVASAFAGLAVLVAAPAAATTSTAGSAAAAAAAPAGLPVSVLYRYACDVDVNGNHSTQVVTATLSATVPRTVVADSSFALTDVSLRLVPTDIVGSGPFFSLLNRSSTFSLAAGAGISTPPKPASMTALPGAASPLRIGPGPLVFDMAFIDAPLGLPQIASYDCQPVAGQPHLASIAVGPGDAFTPYLVAIAADIRAKLPTLDPAGQAAGQKALASLTNADKGAIARLDVGDLVVATYQMAVATSQLSVGVPPLAPAANILSQVADLVARRAVILARTRTGCPATGPHPNCSAANLQAFATITAEQTVGDQLRAAGNWTQAAKVSLDIVVRAKPLVP